jgi:hypothetical protein
VDRFAELVEEAGAPDNFAYVVVDAPVRTQRPRDVDY